MRFVPPGFEDGVETGGGDPAEDPAQQQHGEAGGHLAQAVEDADAAGDLDTIVTIIISWEGGYSDLAQPPPPVLVCQGPGEAAEHAGGEVAGQEEEGDLLRGVASVTVQYSTVQYSTVQNSTGPSTHAPFRR